MRQRIDKIASSTRNVTLRRDARLGERVTANAGYVVAGRIHGEKSTYNMLEDVHGRLVPLHDGDVIAGVLGPRNALQGYAGFVPEAIQPGDVLQVLNTGGVIGRCTSQNPDVGPPFDIEILGSVLVFPEFENRSGVAAQIGMNAISAAREPLANVPVVYIAGTCMNSGKTLAACRLIRELTKRGKAVGACKLTGVSLRRDALQMHDYGARTSVSFNDAGIVSTTAENAVETARTLFAHLIREGAEVIVAELGDGILGEYGVQEILADAELKRMSGVFVLCANDPVGVWGSTRVLKEKFEIGIDVVCGPATDNSVGTRYVSEQLGLTAINARTHGVELGEFVAGRIGETAGKTTS
ncbi:MAG: hypothetical protein IID33_05350 [Planctomycetes bacterium]|nr:hypothetical protein [Planctomycetota bacterium]